VFQLVRTTDAQYRAKHWEAVRAAITQDADVFLPKSDPSRAGHCVRVTRGPQGATFYALRVVAQSEDKINGSAALSIGTGFGFRDFMDEGDGNWSASPVI
jgi:hypothetical protein